MSWVCEHDPGWAHGRCVACRLRAARAWFVGRRLGGLRGDPRAPVLVATILGSAMAFVDATVVNVALPTISEDLGLSFAGSQWVFLSYSLALASLYLVAGAVGDRVGQRRTFALGVAGFAATSLLAGLAWSGPALIGARALQGVGGAFLTTSSLALLRSTYGGESGRAVGIWTAWTGVAALIGPPLGGALVELASWRWIFMLNLPIAAGALVLAGRGRATTRPGAARPFDLGGALALAVGFGTLTYGLVQGAENGFDTVWWALALAVAALAAGLWHERRTPEPMLPLELFRRRNFAAANAVTFLVYAALGGSTFFLVLYLQSVVGFSPLEASLTMIPISLVMLVLAGRFGRLSDRDGPRRYLTVGPALLAVGMVLWAFVEERSDWPLLVVGVLVFALGLSITVAPITATALASAPERYAGIAAGVNNTVSRLGGLVAVAVLGLVVSLVFTRHVGVDASGPLSVAPQDADARQAAITAFRTALLVAAGLALAGSALAASWISDDEARVEPRPRPEATTA